MRDHAWSLRSFCVAEIHQSEKETEKGSDIDIRRGAESGPLASLSKRVIYFLIGYSVQFRSIAQSCLTLCNPWTAGHQASLSITNTQSLYKFMSIQSVMPFNHLILCHTLLPCLQSFPASRSFPMSQFFTSGGQSIGASASASVLPMNIQDWSPLGWTGWISLQSKGLSRVFSTSQFKSINSLAQSFKMYKYSIIQILPPVFFSFFSIHCGPIKSQFYISTHWETSMWKLLVLFPCMTMVILNSQ